MHGQQAHAHHYVPQWYQKRFLKTGKTKYLYLDLHPEKVVGNGFKYERRSLFQRGPKMCFCEHDLYTLKFDNLTTDEIEKNFFGDIDSLGRNAVALFSDYHTFKGVHPDQFRFLTGYMGAQRFRTPKGLDYLKEQTQLPDKNAVLALMQNIFEAHVTMWTEGVWEIVRARKSATKFIVSDNPVTFYNRAIFPHFHEYPDDVGLHEVGTRTLFPLGSDSCLIITHVELTRNPRTNPSRPRTNARNFGRTMKYILETQFGRELEEDEVLRINFILKKRAARYIAAAQEEWLFPERNVSTRKWTELDDDWFLLPNMYKVPFGGGILAGSRGGPTFTMDEYGRNPSHPGYKDKSQHEKEWITFNQAKKEWAKKRRGRSLAQVETGSGKLDDFSDRVMFEDLQKLKE